MKMVDSQYLTTLGNVSLIGIDGSRSIMFLNNGQTMIVSSINNNALLFFNRTSISPIKYAFAFSQLVNCPNPHGLWHVNDSFFYVTSYKNNSIYSYTANSVYSSWTEALVFNAPKPNNSTGATHLTIDECGRFWISMETDTTLIFDQQGNLLGSLTIPTSSIFDILITDNYLMYFSDSKSNRTFRLDPKIQC